MKFIFKALLHLISLTFIILSITSIFNAEFMIVPGILLFNLIACWEMYDTENNENEISLLEERIKKLEKQVEDKEKGETHD